MLHACYVKSLKMKVGNTKIGMKEKKTLKRINLPVLRRPINHVCNRI